MNLLLDTNILVYISRAKDTDKIIDFIAADGANLYISVVQWPSLDHWQSGTNGEPPGVI